MTGGRTWFPLTGPVIPTGVAMAATARRSGPIDPLSGPKIALAGRVVTMNEGFAVKDDGVIYLENGSIVAVQERRLPAPASFAGVTIVESGGTIFPGLIELHNHLSYNALPPWSPVPKKFQNRGQWPNHADYRPLVSGPMTVLSDA